MTYEACLRPDMALEASDLLDPHDPEGGMRHYQVEIMGTDSYTLAIAPHTLNDPAFLAYDLTSGQILRVIALAVTSCREI